MTIMVASASYAIPPWTSLRSYESEMSSSLDQISCDSGVSVRRAVSCHPAFVAQDGWIGSFGTKTHLEDNHLDSEVEDGGKVGGVKNKVEKYGSV